MNVQTGVYVPGTAFHAAHVEFIVSTQRPAIIEGAYHGTNGVKQRVIIVDNEEAKTEFKKSLLYLRRFYRKLSGGFEKRDAILAQLANDGKKLALSQRIITLEERKQNSISLKKLYIGAPTWGVGSQKYCTSCHKHRPFGVGLIAGLTVGALASAMTTSTLALVSGLGVFVGGVIYQTLRPAILNDESGWQKLCEVFDEHGLHCKDIRLLSEGSGDRVRLLDMHSASDRERARGDTSGPRAQDEQLAECLRSSPRKVMYGEVSGYQGRVCFAPDGSRIFRFTSYSDEDSSPVSRKMIKQKYARVTSKV